VRAWQTVSVKSSRDEHSLCTCPQMTQAVQMDVLYETRRPGNTIKGGCRPNNDSLATIGVM